MEKLHVAYNFFVAHWLGISVVLSWIIDNVANMIVDKHPTEASWLRRLVNHIAITTTNDFPVWKMKMIFSHGPVAKSEEAHPPVSPILPLIFMMFCLSISACKFCEQPTNKNTAECKAYRVLSQCGPKTLAMVAADWQDFLNGDIEKILTDAITQLGSEYDCFSLAIKDGLAAKYGTESAIYARYLKADSAARVALAKGRK